MEIKGTKTGWVLETEQFLDLPRGELFSYFGNAGNLEEITPPWLNFRILTPLPIEMKPGALIDYQLKLHGIPIKWRTEIAAWEPPYRFVDQQLRGPYRKWHHEHFFQEHEGGTLMTDRVNYEVLGGSIVHSLFVKKDLERIFQYRRDVLTEKFSLVKS